MDAGSAILLCMACIEISATVWCSNIPSRVLIPPSPAVANTTRPSQSISGELMVDPRLLSVLQLLLGGKKRKNLLAHRVYAVPRQNWRDQLLQSPCAGAAIEKATLVLAFCSRCGETGRGGLAAALNTMCVYYENYVQALIGDGY
ncbi:hypothetical protein GQ54DRAFT_295135 [Martensiomyces pterosporus]|nr:hypothetical protein GQ54DRAFT_295135 [Martensiomyces pterosporus]